MNDPVETSELVAFTRTVDARSLSRAAIELGVPRATLGRRLARLEERLGVRLLRRTTRSLALTDAGDAFYRHARIALDAVSQAEASVRHADEAVRGTLRVSAPPLNEPSFHALMCDFARRYPQVQLHVHFSSAYVDLHRDGYDVALRASTQLEPGLVARTLQRMPVVAVASPDYLAQHGTPRSHRDLRRHLCLLGFARGEVPQTHWPLSGGGKVRVEGAFFSNEITLLCEAAVHGLGIALLPMILTGRLIEEGRLVRVLPGVVEADSRFAIVYPERELVPPQVRAFIDAVVTWSAERFGREASPSWPGAPARGAPRPAKAAEKRRPRGAKKS